MQRLLRGRGGTTLLGCVRLDTGRSASVQGVVGTQAHVTCRECPRHRRSVGPSEPCIPMSQGSMGSCRERAEGCLSSPGPSPVLSLSFVPHRRAPAER